MIWTTESGSKIKISEMTDAHLDNAIAFVGRKPHNLIAKFCDALCGLLEEKKKRVFAVFMKSSEDCPYCKSKMVRQELDHDYSQGFAPRKYAFFCRMANCGAKGPNHEFKHSTPTYDQIYFDSLVRDRPLG